MSSRFSTLFDASPRLEVELQPATHKKNSVKFPLLSLFTTTTLRPLRRRDFNHKLGTLMLSTFTSPPKSQNYNIVASTPKTKAETQDVNLQKKRKKQEKKSKGEAGTITISPPKSTSTSHELNSKRSSNRDSKFSSISASSQSTHSFHSALSTRKLYDRDASTHSFVRILPQFYIPAHSLARLQSLTRRATRCLRRQEYLTEHLSSNLAFLMARKEWTVAHGRLGEQRKREWSVLLASLRGLVGKALLKKAIFAHRSQGLVLSIGTSVMGSPTRAVCDPDDAEIDEGKVRLCLDVPLLMSHLETLKEDLHIQGELNLAMREGIMGPCLSLKFLTCKGEQVDMARFVKFVDARMRVLEACYGCLRTSVGEIEDLLGVLGAFEGFC